MTGRSPPLRSGSGSQASPAAAEEASAPSVSIPNAALEMYFPLVEYGTWSAQHMVCTLGPHTGHFVKVIAHCENERTASLLGASAKMARALRRILDAEDDAPDYGLCDCVDNNGARYQSADLASAIIDARQAYASAMSAGTAETPQEAQGEARQRDPKGDAQPPSPPSGHPS